ncbi:peptide MFS transporter [Sphingosinicella sp. CPCC 101087]|uniref:peptide MFS transporter n=1 Tax=Sphingosinicella sp. CPCC 101087 TaxID=2497754 RepID=UPI00101DD7FA|nr:peptide MFS transporter [Sphingosinicella sp. CPCC 101087]
MTDTAATLDRGLSSDRSFFGHPKGLAFLAFTEAWERFSYYGMSALLVLYMVNQLLLPGHVENVAGLAGFRGVIEGVVGPLSPQAFASQIFGLYAGFVYFTPVLGGIVADRWIGQRNAVVLGALAMSGGHVAMAFDATFLLALLLLVLGSGLLKGNISAQVGALYPKEDEAARTRGFAIFSMAINFGAVAGPILCGLLAQLYGWHAGFGAAALFMLAGLATYLAGYRHLPARVERRRGEGTRLSGGDWKVIAALMAVMLITVFQSIAYYQIYNVGLVWIQSQVDLSLGAFTIPVPWYASVDPLFSILAVPLLFALWRWQAARGGEPGDLAKIGIGAALSAAANLLLAAVALLYGEAPVHPVWPFLYAGILGVAFLWYWPTLLALVSRAAPAGVNATLMGVAFLTLFVANNLIGWIGGFYETFGAPMFWLLHAAIGAAGAVLVLLFSRPLARAFLAEERQPLRPAARVTEKEV